MAKELAEIVASCPNPKCTKPIRVDHPYSWCSECGEPLTEEIKSLLQMTRSIAAQDRAAQESPVQSVSPDTLIRRYRDAYQSARIIVGAGSGIKVLGPILAALFAIASFKGDGYLLFAGLAFSFALGVSFYIAGVMISAQGQLLQANIDSAVNTSPILDNEQKSKVLEFG